ncbi:hypothetical protein AXF42_Ash011511 [Apostasia shenzhenica]|uniref:Uncharacterized protein n=1 Tax=Apostasia shenzhenica TaxID=1088818 RepID=A0A2I0BAW7_9ASPA|nr:hypothetical protein AXF42_Ash011511 [Apostasia shenzhenica]
MVPPKKGEVLVRLLRLQATARQNCKNAVGRVVRWQCTIPKNIGERHSNGMRDWSWDDLREERYPGPQTSARFQSAVH